LISIKKGVGSKICARQFQISAYLLDFALRTISSLKLSEKTSKPKDCRHDDHRCHLEAFKNDEFGGP
jgi:hypothetical protein